MERLLVVGLGNPLFGDDGFGSCLAQYLSQYNSNVLDGDAHGIGILGSLINYDFLVFVDVDTRLPPGAVAIERVEGSLTIEDTRLVDAHRAPPSILVGYLRAMGVDVKAYLIAVGPGTLEPLSPPSEEVLKSVDVVVAELQELVRKLGGELNIVGDVREAVKNCYKNVLRQ
ncbi:MAG: hydrogenase maturation protease [Pyrobaculum sp.]